MPANGFDLLRGMEIFIEHVVAHPFTYSLFQIQFEQA